jgi:aspartyl-tRNA(Asn)/glutamyl-tRNA(Gln) amidotransferase subunit C
MSLDSSVVEHIAKLARIDIDHLSSEEREKLVEDMKRIVNFVDLLEEVDVEGVEPMAHPVPLRLRMEPDEARETPGAKTVLSNAPESSDDSFLVPQVVSGGEDDEG